MKTNEKVINEKFYIVNIQKDEMRTLRCYKNVLIAIKYKLDIEISITDVLSCNISLILKDITFIFNTISGMKEELDDVKK